MKDDNEDDILNILYNDSDDPSADLIAHNDTANNNATISSNLPLPPITAKLCEDLSGRDSRSILVVIFAKLCLISAIIGEKIQIFEKQYDESVIISAGINCLNITDSRQPHSCDFEEVLRILLGAARRVDDKDSISYEDLSALKIERNLIFAGGKIKQAKKIETGNIQSLTYGSNSPCFFTTANEKTVSELLGKKQNTALLNDFIIINSGSQSTEIVDVPIDGDLVNASLFVLKQLTNILDRLGDKKIALHLSDEAQQRYYEYRTSLDERIASSEAHEGHIAYQYGLRYLILKLAINLHVTDCAERGEQIDSSSVVDLTALERAEILVNQIEQDAGNLFATIFAETPLDDYLIERIYSNSFPVNFTLRDVLRRGLRNLNSPPKVGKALQALVIRGYLKENKTPKTKNGGRPTVEYSVVDTFDTKVDSSYIDDNEVTDYEFDDSNANDYETDDDEIDDSQQIDNVDYDDDEFPYS